MDADERKAHFLLKHTHVGESPRFNGAALKANTKLNYEKPQLKLWYFLAIIGDYESMLLILVDPLLGTPSINADSLKSFCNHRYFLPSTPLTKGLKGPSLTSMVIMFSSGRHHEEQHKRRLNKKASCSTSFSPIPFSVLMIRANVIRNDNNK
jgi:hypothetical protein